MPALRGRRRGHVDEELGWPVLGDAVARLRERLPPSLPPRLQLDAVVPHRRERRGYEFSRSFAFPVKVDPEKVTATVKDGVLENPRACKFDPKVLACTGADSDSCLTPPQVEAGLVAVTVSGSAGDYRAGDVIWCWP